MARHMLAPLIDRDVRLSRIPLASLLLAALLGGCSDSEPDGPVEIRVRNASAVVMQDVVVGFPMEDGDEGGPVAPGDAESGDVIYGTVQPGSATPYRTILQAYRYARVTLTADDRALVLQPTDYVGESLLEPGRYTYELHFDGSSLGLTLARD